MNQHYCGILRSFVSLWYRCLTIGFQSFEPWSVMREVINVLKADSSRMLRGLLCVLTVSQLFTHTQAKG